MTIPLKLYDAHNHWQDERLDGVRAAAIEDLRSLGLSKMVVNGASAEDWDAVTSSADRYPEVIPSYGVHPWCAHEVQPGWEEDLRHRLEERPSAVGEIGLDRWIKDYDLARQEDVFLTQWRLAVALQRPVAVHCLKTWGRLFELLRGEDRPKPGFLLHSYGGSVEMVEPLAELGAYFSLSGYFAHPRKSAHAETFRHVPADRLLLETDAPDMWPPEAWNEFPLRDERTGKPINHPANIGAVYRFAAALRGEPLALLAGRVEENFERLFGVASGKG